MSSAEDYRVRWIDPVADFYDEFVRRPSQRMKRLKTVSIYRKRYDAIYKVCRMKDWPKEPPAFYILYGIRVEPK